MASTAPRRGRCWGGAVLGVSLFSLWMRTGFPVHAIPGASADDALFVALARHLGDGQWLGRFDDLTLVKGMFYPLFILAAFGAGVALKIAEQAVYLGAAYLVARCVRPAGGWMAGLVFAALALDPVLWTEELARVIREGLVIGLSLAAIGACAWIGFADATRSGRRWGVVGGALTGLVWAAFWLTREEGVWLVPAVLVGAGCALMAGPRGDGALVRRMVPFAVAAGVMIAAVSLVGAVNFVRYGAFETTEVKSLAFRRGYGALARITPEHWARYVVFPRDARAKAFAASPAARELAPFLDGPIGASWRWIGCTSMGRRDCPEILSGWFQWALRDAVAAAGHYGSAADAARFYTTLADQIDAACARRVFACSAQRASLAPPFRWNYVADTVHDMPAILGILLRPGGTGIGSTPSLGAADMIARFSDMVGPVARAPVGGMVVRGWVAGADGVPGLTVTQAGRAAADSPIVWAPAPDVAAAFAGLHSARFEITTHCGDCAVVVGGAGALPLATFGRGFSWVRGGVRLYVDDVVAGDFVANAGARRRALIGQAARAIAAVFDAGLGVACVLACAGLGFCWLRRRAIRVEPVLVALAAMSGVGVMARVVLLAYVDVTAIPAANALYAAPASPLLILFACIGCMVGGQAIAGHRRRLD